MQYHKTIILKDGRACTLRNGTAEDGEALLKIFNLTHTQTDYLLTYPEEHSYTVEDEAELLRRKTDSVDEIEILAFVDGAIVGSAGVTCVDRAGFDRRVHRMRTDCRVCTAGAGGGRREQKRPRPVQERGLPGVRQEPEGLSLPADRLAGAGAHAAGAGRAKRCVRDWHKKQG